jgi:hypothetical protein
MAWTDPDLTTAPVRIRRIHLIDMRDALRQAYVQAGKPELGYTQVDIVAGVTRIKAVDVDELQAAVVALE